MYIKQKTSKNRPTDRSRQRGIAHIVGALLVVVVLAAITGAGSYVRKHHKMVSSQAGVLAPAHVAETASTLADGDR